jgi:hypothetical protein
VPARVSILPNCGRQEQSSFPTATSASSPTGTWREISSRTGFAEYRTGAIKIAEAGRLHLKHMGLLAVAGAPHLVHDAHAQPAVWRYWSRSPPDSRR